MAKKDPDFDGLDLLTPDAMYWNPEKKGETLVGVFEKSYKGQKHNRHIVRDENGQGWILPDAYFLREVFKSLQQKSKIRIRYDGVTMSKKNTNIYHFTVGKVLE